MNSVSRLLRFDRAVLLFWTAFIGVGAVGGSLMFFLDPAGGFIMDGILPAMQAKLPFADTLFSNLIFPGISLLIVNGISNLTAFVLILRRHELGYRLGALFGFTLMLWISIQFYVFAPEVWPIDVAYFLFGVLQLLFGFLAFVRLRQSRLPVSVPEPAGGRGTAVVFFSRTGSVRRLAADAAARENADLIELKTGERTGGDLGFLWCGRFGMHRWGMPLLPYPDLSGYRRVLVFSPVWVFSLAAPIRQFLSEAKDALPGEVELTAAHFMRGRLPSVFREAKAILGDKLTRGVSLCVRFGRAVGTEKLVEDGVPALSDPVHRA